MAFDIIPHFYGTCLRIRLVSLLEQTCKVPPGAMGTSGVPLLGSSNSAKKTAREVPWRPCCVGRLKEYIPRNFRELRGSQLKKVIVRFLGLTLALQMDGRSSRTRKLREARLCFFLVFFSRSGLYFITHTGVFPGALSAWNTRESPSKSF